MGKVINPDAEPRDREPVRVVTGKDAERLHDFLTRPAQEPTPRMQQAIENYRRLKAVRRTDNDDPSPSVGGVDSVKP